MSDEDLKDLLSEIEEILMGIESLQPELHEQDAQFGSGQEATRAKLTALRRTLARDMERLHADGNR